MEVNIIGAINRLGYGRVTTNVVYELISHFHGASLFPLGQIDCHSKYVGQIKQALQNADRFNKDAPCIKIWHQHDLAMFVGKGKHIGFPIFELDRFTPKEHHHLRSCDGLFVCSNWARNIILKDTCVDADVVPLGVDTEFFFPKESKRKPTVFLNVGKWEVRKGHDKIVGYFNEAFTQDDNVELWLMVFNPFFTEEQMRGLIKEAKSTPLGEKIRFIPPVNTEEAVARIMQQADCGLFPSRAEGWGLPILEMMACGKHIITTNYSGHTEFCNGENSILIDTDEMEVAVGRPGLDERWFHAQGEWACLDSAYTQDQFVEHMKGIHDLKQSNQLKMNEGGIYTAETFSWNNTTMKILTLLGAKYVFDPTRIP